jgi:glycosyltransferase involved in cell wall biosynthesis
VITDDRLRIGLLAPQFPPGIGGMQELAVGLARALAYHDDVCVYTLREQGIPDAPFRQRAVLDKRRLDSNLAVVRAEEDAVDVWCAMDAGLSPLACFARRPFFAYFHGNDFLTPGYGFPGEWGGLLVGKPLVWRFARPARRMQRRRLMRKSLPSLREIFTNSRSTAQLIARTYPDHGRQVTVVPPGVADDCFQEREPGPADVLRLLTISRLTRQARRKNVDGILCALRLLKTESPNLRFTYTVVGDGDDRSRLEALALSLGLAEQVTFRGFVSREALLAALRQTDLFVLAPLATDYDVEGFGIVYLEASATGVPVIGSAEGGAVDAIENGTNGILIEASAPAAIAGGIRRFHARRQEFPAVRVRAFAERFRWSEIGARLRARIAVHVARPQR